MSRNFEQQQTYASNFEQGSIPNSIQSGPVRKTGIDCMARQVVAISNSGAQTSGGAAYTQLPTGGNEFGRSGSFFYRFTVSVVRGTTGATLGFGNALNTASSLINRITLQSGGSNLEVFNYYNVVEPMQVLNKTNNNFLVNELKPTEGALVTNLGSTTSLTTKFEVCVPLLFGLLNAPDHDVPLALMSAPLTLYVEYNSQPFQCFVDSATSITSWTIDYQGVVYTSLKVDADHIKALKMSMLPSPENNMLGGIYSIPTSTSTMVLNSANGSVNNVYGIQANSLQQVNWTYITNPNSQDDGMPFSNAAQTLMNIYCDNNLMNQVGPLDCTQYLPQVFLENRKSWNALYDSHISYAVSPDSNGNNVIASSSGCPYAVTVFTGGVSCRCFQDGNFCFQGTPCQMLRIEATLTGSSSTNIYILYTYDILFSIDSTGAVSRNI